MAIINTNSIYADYGAAITGASADTTVKNRAGLVYGVAVNTAGAASAIIEYYDGAVATGAKVGQSILTAAGGIQFSSPIHFKSSIHVKTTDSGGNAICRVLFR